MQDDDNTALLLDEIRRVHARVQGLKETVAFGFLVIAVLLLGLCFDWLRWHGALALAFPKPPG